MTHLMLLIGMMPVTALFSQDYNLSFEDENFKPWFYIGQKDNFEIKLDSSIRSDGRKSLSIQNSKPTTAFGGLMQFLPNNLQGDSIEVTALVKLKDVSAESKLGFMLRIDPNVHFDNFAQANINGTSDWKEYKIKAKLNPKKTSAISIAIFLAGEGKIWADQLRIKVDGEVLDKKMFIPYAEDHSSITTSNVPDFNGSSDIYSRLADLAKIWGLLKYRHPQVGKGKFEWDIELFKSINKILSIKDDKDLELYYLNLLDTLGAVDQVVLATDTLQIKQSANYGWIDKLPFDNRLKKRLSDLRYASFDKNYYYSFNAGIGNVRIENEHPYAHIQNPDIGFRLLSLFRYWNIVQYFSPYRHLTDMPWDDVLSSYIPKMIAAKTQLEYEKTAAAMIAEMKDAHTKLWGNAKALNKISGERLLPVVITFAENQPIVSEVIGPDDSGLMVGDLILKKNGKSIKEIRDSAFYRIASPNPAVVNREMSHVLGKSINDVDLLEIDRNNKIITLEVSTIAMKDYKVVRDTTPIKYFDNDIAYLNHGLLTSKILEQNEEKLRSSKGIILDCRNYPKDFLVFILTPHLLPAPTAFVKFSKTDYRNLGDFTFTPELKVGENNPDYFKGKIAILINENTQSSAEYHAMAYQKAPNAQIFGSQTAGADGNVSQFYLPGGLFSMISGIGVYYPDGGETQRVGIVPNHEVKPTIKGIREGKDEVLEKAIEFMK